MTAGRKTDDAYPLRIDLPIPSVQAHCPQGLLGIQKRHLRAACGQAIFQHNAHDAVQIEPTRDPVSLWPSHHSAVASARTNDHGHPVGLRGRMDGQAGVFRAHQTAGAIRSLAGPEREFGRRGGLCGKSRRSRQAQDCCNECGKGFPTGMHAVDTARVWLKKKPQDAADDPDSSAGDWTRCPPRAGNFAGWRHARR